MIETVHPAAITRHPSRLVAVLEAVATTAIWGSSFVLVKLALADLGPLTIAGLRYFGGFLLLAPWLLARRRAIRALPRSMWFRLLVLGVSVYVLGNGAFFWGLKTISPTTGSLLMSFIPLIILLLGILFLRETPTWLQAVGVIATLCGGALFFGYQTDGIDPLGVGLVALSLVGYVAFALLGRDLARQGHVDTLTLTALPLGLGGGLALLLGLAVDGAPSFTPTSLIAVGFLVVVNTALGYMLYNHALQQLTAVEANSILNLQPLGTAALSGLMLDERLGVTQIVGMIIMIGGVMLVTWRRRLT